MRHSSLRGSWPGLLIALLVWVGWIGTTWGQKPTPPVMPNPLAPVLKPAVPLGMQRGTTLDLTLTGTNLQDPTGLWTSFPAKVTIPTEGNNGKEPTKLLVRLQVAADAPLGFHTLRLATTRGMSNFRLFCIDDLPQVLRTGTNRAKNMAQEVPVPCVVVGKVDAEVSDWYKVKVQAGQRVSFEVLGRRLGSALDPSLKLYDAKTGKELPDGYSEDAPGLQTDPRLTYVFKEAGEYLVEVHDVSYRGAEDFHYRLRIGDFPCCTTPLPMAAKRGSKVTVTFAGPTADLAQPVPVQAPTDPTVSTLWVAPRGANGLHGWPVALALSDIAEILETEPNNEIAKANRLPVPGAVTGRLQTKEDQDHFVFAAKKGQRLILDAQTTDLGSPSEVALVLRDAKGNQLQASSGAAAPRLDFSPTADGDYVVSVEHLLGWFGPAETYRLSVTPYQPDFELSVGIDRYDVAPGGTRTIPLVLTRAGYVGPVEVSVVGPAGLGGTATIAANLAAGSLNLMAVPQMAAGPHAFLIQGKATIDGKVIIRYASVRAVVSREMANLLVPPATLYHQLAVAVTEKPPFTLAARLDPPQAMPGKPAMLIVTTARSAGFTAEIALTLTGQPAGVTAKPQKIAVGQNEVKIPLNLTPAVAVGTFPLNLAGTTKHNGRDYINTISVPLMVKK